MKDINNICKLVPCHNCAGEGVLNRYPHYSIPMPEMESEKCEKCRGKGEVVFVSWKYNVVKDTSFGTDL